MPRGVGDSRAVKLGVALADARAHHLAAERDGLVFALGYLGVVGVALAAAPHDLFGVHHRGWGGTIAQAGAAIGSLVAVLVLERMRLDHGRRMAVLAARAEGEGLSLDQLPWFVTDTLDGVRGPADLVSLAPGLVAVVSAGLAARSSTVQLDFEVIPAVGITFGAVAISFGVVSGLLAMGSRA